MLEKLQLTDERNLLIQGLPSSIEKQFVKLAFAKNLTPLLKSKKIDFALVFAINEQQLGAIVREVLPALGPDGKFWVAYPKPGSKIAPKKPGENETPGDADSPLLDMSDRKSVV